MGLDIYLRRCDDWEKALTIEEEFEEKSSKLWEECCQGRQYDDIPEAELEEYRRKVDNLRNLMGIKDYRHESIEDYSEHDSNLHHEHYFKLGYYRSSYNDAGFNRVAETYGFGGLYQIFGYDREDDPYIFMPDWEASLVRAKEALRIAREVAESPKGKLMAVFADGFVDISSAEEAINIASEHLARKSPNGFNSYSAREGLFYLEEPLKVIAAIPGRNCINTKGVYLVCQSENRLQWYIEALEVVVESIEFVLSHSNPNSFRLYWSS